MRKYKLYSTDKICLRLDAKFDVVIGIDPDTEASGVAIKRKEGMNVTRMTLPDLVDFFLQNSHRKVFVRVSAGWLNPVTSWHKGGNAAKDKRIASYVGANHQTGKHIVEFARNYFFEVELVKPTTTKLDPAFFLAATGIRTPQCDSDYRDAAALLL